jgi:hypothetical protein
VKLLAIDLRSLAALRIGIASLLLIDLFYRAVDLEAHYTNSGALPDAARVHLLLDPLSEWSLHSLCGSAGCQIPLFGLAALAALALLVGYRTRVAGPVCWLLLLSIQHRNPLILTAGDFVLRLLLFWSLFLPTAARWSLERRAGRAHPESEPWILSPASAGLLVQVALVYVFSVGFKLGETAWRDLVAIEGSLRVEGVATAFGSRLLEFPDLLSALTALTLVLEALGPLLAFSPWRTAAVRTALVFTFWGFHLFGIGSVMRLGLVHYAMALAWVPFLPARFWDALRLRIPAGPTPGPARHGLRSRSVQSAMAAACLALVLAENVVSIDRGRFQPWLPFPMVAAIRGLGLGQDWRLWERPLHNRYYVFAARLRDGRQIDLHRDAPLDWDRPRRDAANNHWWKYHLHLSRPYGRSLRGYYAAYLARKWNRGRDPAQWVESLELVLVDARRPGAPPHTLPRRALWSGDASRWASGGNPAW